MSDIVRQDNIPRQVTADANWVKAVAAFNEALSAAPGKDEIKKHPFIKVTKTVNGEKQDAPLEYLPIEYVEAKLNHFFHGLWQVTNFKYTVIVNEVVGDLELAVYHPQAGVWLRRAGTGAVLIQQRAEYETNAQGQRVKKAQDLLDINRKVANTLTKDMGHLKAECIKNAAKSFGRTFGSDLARDLEDTGYADTMLTPEAIMEEMQDIATQAELRLYYETLPVIAKNDKRIKTLLKEKELAIKSKEREAKNA